MGMTMTQKILAAHAGLAEVKAGQLIEADLDLLCHCHSHDLFPPAYTYLVTAPMPLLL